MSKPLNSTRLEHLLEAAQRIARRMPDVSLADFVADEKQQAGASLLQLYTGFVYESPGLVRGINERLARRVG